jgi:hypothetical protein
MRQYDKSFMLNVNVVYRLQIVEKDSQDLRTASRSRQKVIIKRQSALHSCSWSRFTQSLTVRRQNSRVFGFSLAHHYMSACSDIILRLVCGRPLVSTPGHFKWYLRWTVCQWGTFISVYFDISLTTSSNHSSNFHRSSITDNLRK